MQITVSIPTDMAAEILQALTGAKYSAAEQANIPLQEVDLSEQQAIAAKLIALALPERN